MVAAVIGLPDVARRLLNLTCARVRHQVRQLVPAGDEDRADALCVPLEPAHHLRLDKRLVRDTKAARAVARLVALLGAGEESLDVWHAVLRWLECHKLAGDVELSVRVESLRDPRAARALVDDENVPPGDKR